MNNEELNSRRQQAFDVLNQTKLNFLSFDSLSQNDKDLVKEFYSENDIKNFAAHNPQAHLQKTCSCIDSFRGKLHYCLKTNTSYIKMHD